eukprot:286243_1
MAPWARLVAQIMFTAGNSFLRAFAQALQQAQHQSATGHAKQAANKIMGKMDMEQARKILNVDQPYTAEQITKQFEQIFQINNPRIGGSYYLQCKAEHAKNALHEEILKEMEVEYDANNVRNDSFNKNDNLGDNQYQNDDSNPPKSEL